MAFRKNLLSFLRGNSVRSLVAGAALFSAGMMTQAAEEDAGEQARLEKIKTFDLTNLIKKRDGIDKMASAVARHKLHLHEAFVDHIYFDTEGYATTGMGLNINDWDSFSKLDWVDSEGKILNEEQKKTAYTKMLAVKKAQSKKGFNLVASSYKDTFDFKPTKESLDKMFEERFNDAKTMVKNYLGFRCYDIHLYGLSELYCYAFSLGASKFNEKEWPSLFGFLRSFEYDKAAEETHVKNWQDTRNEAVKKTFLNIPDHYNLHLGEALEDAFTDCVLDCSPNYLNTIRCGTWNKKACVVVGPGIPITKEMMKDLKLNECCGETSCNTLYNAVFNKKEVKEIPDSAVRQCIKKFFESNRKSSYIPLCKKYGINYENLPFEIQAAMVAMDCATGGRLSSYDKFLKAVSRGDWMAAAQQSEISESVFAKNVIGAKEGDCERFNNYTKTVFYAVSKKEADEKMAQAIQQGAFLQVASK